MIAGRLRIAIEGYRASLGRGETPEITSDVYAAFAIEGLSMGYEIMFRDEQKALERKQRQTNRR